MAFSIAIANTGCLEINPDYVRPAAEQFPPASGGTTSAAETPNPPSAEFGQDTSTGVSPSTSASETLTTGAVSSNGTTSTVSSTPSENTSSHRTDGSTSSSSSASTDPIGNQDGTWRAIRIALDAGSSPAENGYSAQLTFDHAQLVARGAAAGGQDLSVVYVQNNQLRSIDRVLDPESSWGSANTRIWFPLQETLSPGSQVETQYYLVVGSSSLPPQQDPNQVFLMFDSFDAGVVNALTWSQHTVGAASGVDSRSFGITMHASSLSAETESRSIRSNWSARHDGVMAELRLRFPKDLTQSCNRLRPVAFESGSNQVRAGLGIHAGSWELVAYSPAQGGLTTEPLPSIHVDQSWARYSLAWHGTTMQAWKGNQQAFQRSSAADSVPRPDTQDIHLRIFTSAESGNCVGNASSDIDIDWVWVRHYASPEPSATLLP